MQTHPDRALLSLPFSARGARTAPSLSEILIRYRTDSRTLGARSARREPPRGPGTPPTRAREPCTCDPPTAAASVLRGPAPSLGPWSVLRGPGTSRRTLICPARSRLVLRGPGLFCVALLRSVAPCFVIRAPDFSRFPDPYHGALICFAGHMFIQWGPGLFRWP